ncbi:MAG: carboxyl transferase domain-containing protein, partial [Marinicella sp.]
MKVIKSQIDAASKQFGENREYMSQLVDDLKSNLKTTALGGSEKSRKKHTDRGKLLVRDRINLLLDPGSPFLEIAPMAATGMYQNAAPAAGVVAGIGLVHG